MVVVVAAMVLFGLVMVFAGLLGVAKERLRVDEDPRIELVNDVLPAANCGGCGFAGCSDFAKAVVEERAECSGCPVGGEKTAAQVAKVLGVEVVKTYPYRPVIHCAAECDQKLGRVPYDGVPSCVEADMVGTTQACTYGCLGFGDCSKACTYDALSMVEGRPVVHYDRCTGCGACITACPRNLIEKIPFKQDRMLVVACSNKEPAKLVKKVCKIGCIGCSLCQRLMGEQFKVSDNLAYLDYDNYTGDEDVSNVLERCPAGVMVYFGPPKPEYLEQLASDDTDPGGEQCVAAQAASDN